MKLLLNCDDVFDSLCGDCNLPGDETALQEHLKSCAACRHWADAASPALGLFQEVAAAIPDDDDCAGSLCSTVLANRIWDRLAAERQEVVRSVQARSFLSLSLHAWSQLGAAAAILLALGTLLWAVAPREGSTHAEQVLLPPFASSLSRASAPEAHGFLHLASLRLPENCLTPTTPNEAAHSGECCTRCHQAGGYLPASRTLAFSQATCMACHKG